MSMHSLW